MQTFGYKALTSEKIKFMATETVRAPALNCQEAMIYNHIVPLALPLRQHHRTLEKRMR